MTRDAWFIDALDGLGGLAFASYRSSDLARDDIELKGAAWVIGAPHFQPRRLSSRAIGEAATRRGLQLGFSVDGETEVAFPSLEALTDFVRRVYVSSGGSDGAAGIVPPGGGTPPEPEGGGESPRSPGPDDGGGDRRSTDIYSERLSTFARAHLSAVKRLDANGDTAHALDQELDANINQLARAQRPFDLIDDLIGTELLLRWQAANRNEFHTIHALRMAISDYVTLTNSFQINLAWPPEYIYLYKIYRTGWHQYILDDPLDVLARFPIPDRITLADKERESWRSVKDLFFGILANPAMLTQSDFSDERAALFLFAAAVQVRRGNGADWFPEENLQSYDAALMSEVLEWLKPQMPRYAFNSNIESTIQEMSRLTVQKNESRMSR